MQQRGAAALAAQERTETVESGLLFAVEYNVLARGRIIIAADAQHLALRKFDKTGLFEAAQRLHRRAGVIADLAAG